MSLTVPQFIVILLSSFWYVWIFAIICISPLPRRLFERIGVLIEENHRKKTAFKIIEVVQRQSVVEFIPVHTQ